tara:strand:+ start:430 stop:1062 length:633 start_codon:yes stop_codon:yes gene_type:complete
VGQNLYTTNTSLSLYLNNNINNRLFFEHNDSNSIYRFAPDICQNGIYNLGSISNKWNTLYLNNGTINTSDDRLKINEIIIKNSINLIESINFYEYDKVKTLNNNDVIHKERGVIAQHLLNTDISYIVYGGGKDELDNDIPYGVRYNDLLVTSCQAIKEQQQIILDLSNQNLNLKNEINSNLLRIQEIESQNIIMKNAINKLLRDSGRSTI